MNVHRRIFRTGAALGLLLTAASCQTPAAAPRTTALPPADATVAVDFSAPRGALRRAERYNNLTDFDLWTEVRGEDVRFMNDQGLHGAVYRIWLPNRIYDAATGRYDIAQLDAYFTDASAFSDAIMFNVMPSNLVIDGLTPAEIKPILKRLIGDLKRRYPKLEYVEAFNEPDHTLSAQLRPEQLYAYYVPFYEAVNELNAELRPERPLKIGGPALFMYNQSWIDAFLDGYRDDPSPAKRLDFLSYHAYGYFDLAPGTTRLRRPPTFFKTDPSEVAKHRPQIEAALAARGLDTSLPTYITELGLYPGPSFDNLTDPRPDYLRQAAGVASLLYWFMEDGDNVPFNWILRHQTEERKDQLITRAGEGRPVPTRTFSPYGNMMLMLSRLKDERVAARSDAIVQGKGVYALATQGGGGAAVMLWNYQHVGDRTLTVRLDMDALPATLRNRTVRLTRYRIDATTSNYWADPARANLQRTGEEVVRTGAGHDMNVALGPNALELIVLEPVR